VEGSLKKMNIEHLSKQPCTPKVQPANADKQVSAYGGGSLHNTLDQPKKADLCIAILYGFKFPISG
jgi:hypothetical protein